MHVCPTHPTVRAHVIWGRRRRTCFPTIYLTKEAVLTDSNFERDAGIAARARTSTSTSARTAPKEASSNRVPRPLPASCARQTHSKTSAPKRRAWSVQVFGTRPTRALTASLEPSQKLLASNAPRGGSVGRGRSAKLCIRSSVETNRRYSLKQSTLAPTWTHRQRENSLRPFRSKIKMTLRGAQVRVFLFD